MILPLAFAALVSAFAGSPSAAAPVQRFTLIIGANSGGAGRPQLQYAISDAERVARVLVDLGGVSPANEIVLKQPRLREGWGRRLCRRPPARSESLRSSQAPASAPCLILSNSRESIS